MSLPSGPHRFSVYFAAQRNTGVPRQFIESLVLPDLITCDNVEQLVLTVLHACTHTPPHLEFTVERDVPMLNGYVFYAADIRMLTFLCSTESGSKSPRVALLKWVKETADCTISEAKEWLDTHFPPYKAPTP